MATKAGKDKKDAISFEEALEELESIVEAMESEKMALETLVESYEKGTQLLKICQDNIDAAQAKIELIAKRAGESGVDPLQIVLEIELASQRQLRAKDLVLHRLIPRRLPPVDSDLPDSRRSGPKVRFEAREPVVRPPLHEPRMQPEARHHARVLARQRGDRLPVPL